MSKKGLYKQDDKVQVTKNSHYYKKGTYATVLEDETPRCPRVIIAGGPAGIGAIQSKYLAHITKKEWDKHFDISDKTTTKPISAKELDQCKTVILLTDWSESIPKGTECTLISYDVDAGIALMHPGTTGLPIPMPFDSIKPGTLICNPNTKQQKDTPRLYKKGDRVVGHNSGHVFFHNGDTGTVTVDQQPDAYSVEILADEGMEEQVHQDSLQLLKQEKSKSTNRGQRVSVISTTDNYPGFPSGSEGYVDVATYFEQKPKESIVVLISHTSGISVSRKDIRLFCTPNNADIIQTFHKSGLNTRDIEPTALIPVKVKTGSLSTFPKGCIAFAEPKVFTEQNGLIFHTDNAIGGARGVASSEVTKVHKQKISSRNTHLKKGTPVTSSNPDNYNSGSGVIIIEDIYGTNSVVVKQGADYATFLTKFVSILPITKNISTNSPPRLYKKDDRVIAISDGHVYFHKEDTGTVVVDQPKNKYSVDILTDKGTEEQVHEVHLQLLNPEQAKPTEQKPITLATHLIANTNSKHAITFISLSKAKVEAKEMTPVYLANAIMYKLTPLLTQTKTITFKKVSLLPTKAKRTKAATPKNSTYTHAVINESVLHVSIETSLQNAKKTAVNFTSIDVDHTVIHKLTPLFTMTPTTLFKKVK